MYNIRSGGILQPPVCQFLDRHRAGTRSTSTRLIFSPINCLVTRSQIGPVGSFSLDFSYQTVLQPSLVSTRIRTSFTGAFLRYLSTIPAIDQEHKGLCATFPTGTGNFHVLHFFNIHESCGYLKKSVATRDLICIMHTWV